MHTGEKEYEEGALRDGAAARMSRGGTVAAQRSAPSAKALASVNAAPEEDGEQGHYRMYYAVTVVDAPSQTRP